MKEADGIHFLHGQDHNFKGASGSLTTIEKVRLLEKDVFLNGLPFVE